MRFRVKANDFSEKQLNATLANVRWAVNSEAHATVACCTGDEQIENSRQDRPLEGSPHYGQAQIDGGERLRQLPTGAQISRPQTDTSRN
ncbi:MAG: hypothetical protein WBV69_01535 [Candidatus Sulfotelmatobacter sp.]